jgi:hemolysin III
LPSNVILPDYTWRERPQTLGEEIANSVSHGLGCLAAIIGAWHIITRAVQDGDPNRIVGVSVYAATMILLYLVSTLYHALPRGQAKHVFRIIEHMAIFFLIAGTYTPFTLGVLRGKWGWTLFGLIWGFALAGVLLKLFGGFRYPRLSTALYVSMGWLVVTATRPLWLHMPHAGFAWLMGGGLAYTAGVAFFTVDHRLRYSHFVWHLFVIAGSTLQYFAVLWYAS